jgi:hypothetical protein
VSKQSVQQFSTSPPLNTDIAGINVNTGWPPNNVGPAFREFMALTAYALQAQSVSIAGLTTFTPTPAQSSAQWTQFAGALTANCAVTLPNALFVGTLQNTTTGGFEAILSSGSGATATVPNDEFFYEYYCDGAGNCGLSSYGFNAVKTAGPVSIGTTLTVATSVTVAGYAVVLNNGGSYGISITGNCAGTAAYATSAGSSTTANSATYATTAGSATYATNASNASYATTAGTVTPYVGLTLGACAFGLASAGVGSGACTFSGSSLLGNTGTYMVAGGVQISPIPWTTGASINCSGSLVGPGFYTVSDKRMKFDIRDLSADDGWSWINAGRPRFYTMNGKPSAGFIAQEEVGTVRANSVLSMPDERPEFAESDGIVEPGRRLLRDYEMDVPFLTAALKDAGSRIAGLTDALAAALARIAALESRA